MVSAVQAELLCSQRYAEPHLGTKTLPASQKVAELLRLVYQAYKAEVGGLRTYNQTTFLRETAAVTDISYGTLLKMWHGEYRIGALQLDQAEKLARFLGLGQMQFLWGVLGNKASPIDMLLQTPIRKSLIKAGYDVTA